MRILTTKFGMALLSVDTTYYYTVDNIDTDISSYCIYSIMLLQRYSLTSFFLLVSTILLLIWFLLNSLFV